MITKKIKNHDQNLYKQFQRILLIPLNYSLCMKSTSLQFTYSRFIFSSALDFDFIAVLHNFSSVSYCRQFFEQLRGCKCVLKMWT